MKPASWQTCTNPARMLDFLRGRHPSARKLRLFACACCRAVQHLLVPTDVGEDTGVEPDAAAKAVAATEAHADGRIDDAALADAGRRAGRAASLAWVLWDDGTAEAHEAAAAAAAAAGPDSLEAAARAAEYATAASQAEAGGDSAGWKSAQRLQAALLRDIIGDPWVPPAPVGGALLAWGGGVAARVARAAFDAGDWAALPVLADALEVAGCTDAVLLGHLRGPGPHARGCWALDAALGLG